MFKKAYEILLANSPRKLKKDDYQKRHEIIAQKISEINPFLKIAFIPRTLYELTYIEQCIQEEINSYESKIEEKQHGWNKCPRLANPGDLLGKSHSETEEKCKKRDCWHLNSSSAVNKDDEYNKAESVVNVAYRLNNLMIKEFKPSVNGFKLNQLMKLTQKKIDFLKEYHTKKNITEILSASGSCGPIEDFASANLKITEKREKIIKSAVKLDCSPISVNSHWIYRGSNFVNDNVVGQEGKGYSLSYGSSLLAGTCKDWNASALYRMGGDQSAYAIPVPFDEIEASPFYIANQQPLPQLVGYGEVFHVRTKASKGSDVYELSGFMGKSDSRNYLESNIEKESLLKSFAEYKKNAVQLDQ